MGLTVWIFEGREKLHENWGTRLGDEIDETGDPPRVWNGRAAPSRGPWGT